MAVVSLVVFNNPSSQVYIIFLPFIPLPSSWVSIVVVHMNSIMVCDNGLHNNYYYMRLFIMYMYMYCGGHIGYRLFIIKWLRS